MLEALKYFFDSTCFNKINNSNLKENEKNELLTKVRNNKKIIDQLIIETVEKKIAGNPLHIVEVEEKLNSGLVNAINNIYLKEDKHEIWPKDFDDFKKYVYEYIKERYFYYRKNLEEFKKFKQE
jgi:hypothetical protein